MKDQTKISKIARIYKLRNLRFHNEKSVCAIAYKLHVSEATIYKSSKRPQEFSTEIGKRRRNTRSSLHGFTDIIDKWILEQEALPKKKRELKTVFYESFAQMPDFKACEATFKKYITTRRKEIIPEKSFFGYTNALYHEPYECQMDLGTAYYFNENNIETKGYIFAVSFPNSSMGYCQIVKSKNSESILSSFQDILRHIGKVPREIWCDNEPCLVQFTKRTEKSIRILSPLFNKFVQHFNLDLRFLKMGKSSGKGSVENKIGYLRNNLLVPLPKIDDLNKYNNELLRRCEALHNRLHYKLEKNILELFKKDIESWQTYPSNNMMIESYLRLRVDYLGRARVKGKIYYVDSQFINRPIDVKLSKEECEIRDVTTDEIILRYKRLVGLELQENVDWSKYLPYIARHPEHAFSHPIMNCFPRSIKSYIIANPVDIVEKFLRYMSDVCKRSNLETSIEIAALCIEKNTLSRREFLNELNLHLCSG